MSLETWLLYVVAVFVLTVTPGPRVLMCVTNAVNHGVRRTFFSAIGSVTAVIAIMACSAIGVGAALAADARAIDPSGQRTPTLPNCPAWHSTTHHPVRS